MFCFTFDSRGEFHWVPLSFFSADRILKRKLSLQIHSRPATGVDFCLCRIRLLSWLVRHTNAPSLGLAPIASVGKWSVNVCLGRPFVFRGGSPRGSAADTAIDFDGASTILFIIVQSMPSGRHKSRTRLLVASTVWGALVPPFQQPSAVSSFTWCVLAQQLNYRSNLALTPSDQVAGSCQLQNWIRKESVSLSWIVFFQHSAAASIKATAVAK